MKTKLEMLGSIVSRLASSKKILGEKKFSMFGDFGTSEKSIDLPCVMKQNVKENTSKFIYIFTIKSKQNESK